VFYIFANIIIRFLLRLLTSTTVKGLGNIPTQGPLVLVANHINLLDPPVIGALLPRPVHFMAKTELYSVPMFGRIIDGYLAFPVRRGELDLVSLRRAERILRAGDVLGIFPEGTRSKTGQLQPGFDGAALFALRLGCPVLPLGISGTNHVLRFPGILLRPKITVKIGPPINFGKAVTRPTRELLMATTTQIMEAIAALVPVDQRGAYTAVHSTDLLELTDSQDR
jgi:1-acyl-sn-glycerol-3-phosphate acyltransferase